MAKLFTKRVGCRSPNQIFDLNRLPAVVTEKGIDHVELREFVKQTAVRTDDPNIDCAISDCLRRISSYY